MKPAIRVENLSKQYRVGARKAGSYTTLREALTGAVAGPVRRLWNRARRAGCETDQDTAFWALKDVSFEVQPGDVIGIIGRNGAGKSTLLKILSRITEPTDGRVEVRGRMGSLLEVGTGFHPELTGRENIYMNGSILGMSRREIDRKFDEIVTFSDIEAFLETPVKRYSSGMYVRLAFSVAAHLEPEILVADEVLAVGDYAFQQKCLGQMKRIGQQGRTVLFVSHNMAAVEALCTRGVLLDGGLIKMVDTVPNVIHKYHKSMSKTELLNRCDAGRNGETPSASFFRSVTVLDDCGEETDQLALGGTLRLRLEIETAKVLSSPVIGIGFDNLLGQRLLTVHTPLSYDAVGHLSGRCFVHCEIPAFPLAPGEYTVKLALTLRRDEVETVEQAYMFTVLDAEIGDEGRGFQRGVCVARSAWRVERADPNVEARS